MNRKADAAPAPAHFDGRELRAALFDLDGTLLDTAGDIALALNQAIAESGWAPVPLEAVKRLIGAGASILVERAAALQGHTLSKQLHNEITQRFFHHYGALGETGQYSAQAYPGAADALRQLHAAGMRLAVVTNKTRRFSEMLLRQRGLMQWVDLLVGGDTCERRKPDPLPLLYACRELGVAVDAALMVGDSINDVEAARAAAMPVIGVTYGYNEGNDPVTLGCDRLIDTLGVLPGMLLTKE